MGTRIQGVSCKFYPQGSLLVENSQTVLSDSDQHLRSCHPAEGGTVYMGEGSKV